MSEYDYQIVFKFGQFPEARVFKGDDLIARKDGSVRRVRRWAKRLVRELDKHGDIVPSPGHKGFRKVGDSNE